MKLDTGFPFPVFKTFNGRRFMAHSDFFSKKEAEDYAHYINHPKKGSHMHKHRQTAKVAKFSFGGGGKPEGQFTIIYVVYTRYWKRRK